MGITAEDLMTKNVIRLTPDMNLLEMDTVLVKRGVSGAPVVERDRLVGVASQADIIRSLWQEHHEAYQHGSYYSSPFLVPISALEHVARSAPQVGNQLAKLTVRDVMTRDPLIAHPENPIEDIAKRMVRDQIHRLPVVSRETHHLVGIISTLDLVHAIEIHGLADWSPESQQGAPASKD